MYNSGEVSSLEQFESVSLLPNRFGIAEFGPREVEGILGKDPRQYQLASENFNWIAAYLCEEVGIFENEVTDWFRMRAKGLGQRSPLAAWQSEDGFEKVFDYAQQYKEQVDEDLGEEPGPTGIDLSQQIGRSALKVIFKAFEVAGADISRSALDPSEERSHFIRNPDRGDLLTARWKRIGDMEDYRITKNEGPATSIYFIVRHLALGPEPVILQTGIGRHMAIDSSEALPGEQTLVLDSDIDGRPSSVGEVASFVVPLANEVRNRSLVLM